MIQTPVPKQVIRGITENLVLSVLVTLVFTVSLSLCAEADALVARAFVYQFSFGYFP